MIFNHIFDDIAFTFQVLYFGKLFIFFGQLKIFTKRRVDNFTMSSIIEFSANIIFDEDIKLSVRMYRKCKESLFEVIILGIFPIKFILLPHFTEAIKSNTFPVSCVFF